MVQKLKILPPFPKNSKNCKNAKFGTIFHPSINQKQKWKTQKIEKFDFVVSCFLWHFKGCYRPKFTTYLPTKCKHLQLWENWNLAQNCKKCAALL